MSLSLILAPIVDTHHAFLLDGDLELLEFEIEKFVSELAGYESSSPDIVKRKYESLGIDNARELSELHSVKSFSADGERIYIITTETLTHEAQNALLKLFEDTHAGHTFFLIVSSVERLLPTLRSRFHYINYSSDNAQIEREGSVKEKTISDKELLVKANTCVEASVGTRMKIIEGLIKEYESDKLGKQDLLFFIGALEKVVKKKVKDTDRKIRALRAILRAEQYMFDRSSSVKMLLEYVGLAL
ncbi:MAG: hypothetical protein V4526_00505 [Patescibacteria group bacterium]